MKKRSIIAMITTGACILSLAACASAESEATIALGAGTAADSSADDRAYRSFRLWEVHIFKNLKPYE